MQSDRGTKANLERKSVSDSFDPSIPFPEWSDSLLNEENWEKAPTKESGTLKPDGFRDSQSVHLPPSLTLKEWKRPKDIYPQTDFVIYIERNDYPEDFISQNNHILQSEFMRRFISSIETLWFLGNYGFFLWEFISPTFSFDSSQAWRPWCHIYSRSKAGKGVRHAPTVNKQGKYIVRLFWLGSWRKIYVDDLLPVNKKGEVMLPMLIQTHSAPSTADTRVLKKESEKPSRTDEYISITKEVKIKTRDEQSYELTSIAEMWPFLLCKALMKIASFTWYGQREFLDFDIIQCLTAWIPYRCNINKLELCEAWDICKKYTEQYKWPEEQLETKVRSKASVIKQKSIDKRNQYMLMANLHWSNEEMYNRFNFNWMHHFLIHETRDKPLVKPTRASDFPLWKRYRWLDWAANEGLIPPTESSTPVRCLKVVDAFSSIYHKRYSKPYVDEQTLSRTVSQKSQDNIEKTPDSIKNKKRDQLLLRNPSFWIDFEDLYRNIEYLTVYFKPSGFSSKTAVSPTLNVNVKEPKAKAKSFDDPSLYEWKEIMYPLNLKSQRNYSLYIFSDSLTKKTMILNLSQTGSSADMENIEIKPEFNIPSSSEESECGICLNTLLERYKRKRQKSKHVIEESKEECVLYTPCHPTLQSFIILGLYNWCTNKQDDYVASLSTYGSSTIVLDLKPGRLIFRLYIKSITPYKLFILADDLIVVGDLYEILNLMGEEPHLLREYCKNVSKSFDILINSFGKNSSTENLRSFYNSYKPTVDLTKKDLNILHETFLDELLYFARKNLGQEKEYFLKILFRKWQKPLGEGLLSFPPEFCYHVDEADEALVIELTEAAKKIQALFRGFHERYLMECHNPRNKQYRSILDGLIVIDNEVFTEKSGVLPFIFRRFFKQPLMENIAPYYPFYDHMGLTVSIQEVAETNCKNSSLGWIFMCRQLFHVNEPLLLKICLFCDLPKYYIKAFNNDTREETRYFTNNIATDVYNPNSRGYTVICYGYASHSYSYSYKLVFIFEKNPEDNIMRVTPIECITDSIMGYYVPNPHHLICRRLFTIYSEVAVASIRLITNYANAQINLKISNISGQVLNENIAFGDVLIPAVFLGGEPNPPDREISKKSLKKTKSPKRSRKTSPEIRKLPSDQAQYIIEGIVLNDSWPFTDQEWKAVNKLKSDISFKSSKTPSEKSARKKSIITLDNPYWTLQVVTNAEHSTSIRKDSKREEEILEIKARWFEQNPKRYDEALALRKKYLQDNLVPNLKKITSNKFRSLDPQVYEEKILPEFDITPFMKFPDDHRDQVPIFKTKEMLEEETSNEQEAIKLFEQKSTELKEEAKAYSNRQKTRYDRLNNWFQQSRYESFKLMEEGENLRNKYRKPS